MDETKTAKSRSLGHLQERLYEGEQFWYRSHGGRERPSPRSGNHFGTQESIAAGLRR